jgi:hypothetical protein
VQFVLVVVNIDGPHGHATDPPKSAVEDVLDILPAVMEIIGIARQDGDVKSGWTESLSIDELQGEIARLKRF